MKLKVLIQTVHINGALIDAKVIGDEDDYDRESSVTIPTMYPSVPCAENGWAREMVPAFTVQELRAAVECMGYPPDKVAMFLGNLVLGAKEFTFDARYLPNIGAVKIDRKVVDLDLDLVDIRKATMAFLATQDDTCKGEWYTTDRSMGAVVMEKFAKHIGVDFKDGA